ncbi:MAG: hypothetical protein M1561_05955 [Gammaproteobacteria bacterium]|nr:hypothetical protein [Gammaproteobacteria bacterium]
MTIKFDYYINKIKKICELATQQKIFFTTYFFIFSFGLTYTILHFNRIPFVQPLNTINEWTMVFFFPNKPIEIINYILCILSIFILGIIYAALSLTSFGSKVLKIFSEKKCIPAIYLIISILANLLLIPALQIHISAIKLTALSRLAVWVILFFIPFYFFLKSHFSFQVNNKLLIKILYFLLFLVCIQFFLIFQPFVFGKLKIMNELWDVPEQTILNNRLVDNTEYINNNHLFGPQTKYDPRQPHPASIDSNCFSIHYSPLVGSLIRLNRDYILSKLKNKIFEFPIYYYTNNELCVIGNANKSQLLQLATNNKEKKDILNFYYKQLSEQAYPKIYTKEEEKFIELNQFELRWQILSRFFIHLHNHVLTPINEATLGKDLNKSYMQYGYLNTVILKNILHFFGNITLDRYIKVLFSFYYLYYALFLMALFLIFKNIRYVFPIFALSVFTLNQLNFSLLYTAPGANPLRHLLDIILLLSILLYSKSSKMFYFLLSLGIGLIFIACYNIFGVFAYLSLLVVWLIKSVIDSKKIKNVISLFCTALILGFAVYKITNVGAHYTDTLLIKGLLGFPYSQPLMISFFIIICLSYITIISSFRKKHILTYPALFLVLYSQGLFFYYISVSDIGHFLIVTPVILLSIFTSVKLFFDCSKFKKIAVFETMFLDIVLIISMVFYCPSIFTYYSSKKEFDNIFKTHQVYQWDLPTAKFVSTMNPAYFIDSINLINEFSNGNNIYIISKYDNFIPFLAKKYSAMPYFDIPWFTASEQDIANCINAIKQNKPKYLFVDSDINRAYEKDIVNYDSSTVNYNYNESVMKVERLTQLKKIFNAVANDYKPLKKALLISVYERRT